MKKTSELLKEAIDVNGELHIDAQKTHSLIRWCEAVEKYSRDMHSQLEELILLIAPVLGPDYSTKLKDLIASLTNGQR